MNRSAAPQPKADGRTSTPCAPASAPRSLALRTGRLAAERRTDFLADALRTVFLAALRTGFFAADFFAAATDFVAAAAALFSVVVNFLASDEKVVVWALSFLTLVSNALTWFLRV